jgi:hypothetical protein
VKNVFTLLAPSSREPRLDIYVKFSERVGKGVSQHEFRPRLDGMLPAFTDEGLLPPGDYHLTTEQLHESMLVVGPGGNYTNWDVKWRRSLVDNLGVLTSQLRQCGVKGSICIGGSFVEDRFHPNDIDGYFFCDFDEFRSGALMSNLNRLDPDGVWTWDPRKRKPDLRGKLQLPMWHRYRIDLYPNHGQPTGFFDEMGQERNFHSLMRWSHRVKSIRGVIQIEEPS